MSAAVEAEADTASADRRRALLRLGALWAAFAVVQLLVALLARYAPGFAMGDVDLAYTNWTRAVDTGHAIPGLQAPFVYPVLALVPMLIASIGGFHGALSLVWLLMVVACNAVAFAFVVGRASSRSRILAGMFLLGGWAALGPISVARIDAVTVAIGLVAVLLMRGRPTASAWLAAVGAWMKIWPVAILAVQAFVAHRWRAAVAAPVIIGVVVVIVATIAGSPLSPLSFLSEQSGRGMQVEAVASTPLMIAAALRAPGLRVYYDQQILTYQVSAGPGGVTYGTILTVLQVLAIVAVLGLSVLASLRNVPWVRLIPVSLLALVLVLIVFNKVGSPQFQSWLLVPMVLWIVVSRRTALVPAVWVLGLEALTQVMYPYLYPGLLALNPWLLVALVVRNVALVGLLAWCLVRIARLWKSGGITRSSAREALHDRRVLRRPERDRRA